MNSDIPDTAPVPAPEAIDPPAAAPAAVQAIEAEEPAAADAVVAEAPAVPAAAAPAVDATAELKALFPALFTGRPKPVKLRIQADIQERAPGKFSKAQLSAFLRRHTGSTGYLIALTQAKTRFDLDGNPAGEITEEHLTAAKDELARRKGLQAERQQVEQERHQLEIQQRRNRAQLLWDFERTTLTEANFCVLKGLTVAELPGILEIARKERAEAPPAPPREARRDDRRDDRRPEGRPQGRPDSRGPRRPDQRGEGRPGGKPGSAPRGGGRPGGAPQPGRKPGGPQQPRRDQAPQAQPAAEAPAAAVEAPKDPAAE
ncbi:MAG: ProQ/FinO family protein [Pelomonas sp.]|nr:ProQ/FinO family protein [Roseateles sp.]